MASSGDVAVRNGSHGINGAHGIKGAHGYSREEIIEVMDELMGMFTRNPVQTQLELLLDQYRSLTTESKKKYHHAAHDKKNPDGSPFFPVLGNDVLTESTQCFGHRFFVYWTITAVPACGPFLEGFWAYLEECGEDDLLYFVIFFTKLLAVVRSETYHAVPKVTGPVELKEAMRLYSATTATLDESRRILAGMRKWRFPKCHLTEITGIEWLGMARPISRNFMLILLWVVNWICRTDLEVHKLRKLQSSKFKAPQIHKSGFWNSEGNGSNTGPTLLSCCVQEKKKLESVSQWVMNLSYLESVSRVESYNIPFKTLTEAACILDTRASYLRMHLRRKLARLSDFKRDGPTEKTNGKGKRNRKQRQQHQVPSQRS